jgi:endonuclease/exonuclease/phosphatase family metal-dependent hydrolase
LIIIFQHIIPASTLQLLSMASSEEPLRPVRMSTTSYDTALCIIPPISQCSHINQLRELYDKAHGRWPPHINLVYPFVAPENLPRARQQIQQHLAEHHDRADPIDVEMNQEGCFKQKNKYTIFLGERPGSSTSSLQSLQTVALKALGQGDARSTLHVTIGQSQDSTIFSREFLLAKARLLPSLRFRVGALAILVRQRTTGVESTDYMSLYTTIDISAQSNSWRPSAPEYWLHPERLTLSDSQLGADSEDQEYHQDARAYDHEAQIGSTFYFDEEQDMWTACTGEESSQIETETVTVSSYNVLIDTEYPPTHDRDPLVVRNILSDSAMADILVLQEVSDDFLSYLLQDTEIQRRYPFTSHGDPNQPDIGPLPSLRNIIILSRYIFNWHSVPFNRKHKGALVAQFCGLPGSQGLVVAGVHLTAGLTDGSVATKKAQMHHLTGYLRRNYENEPWVITGDFNIVTSTYTIDTSLKENSITNETVAALSSIEAAISDAGLHDAWSVARVEAADEIGAGSSEDLFDGEEGATFDPQSNRLAAGTTTTSHDRPQRYDRILVRPQDTLRIGRFNHFGLPEIVDNAQVVASDHYGVRATMHILDSTATRQDIDSISMELPSVEHKRAVAVLSESSGMTSALTAHDMFPTEEQSQQRQDAFALLKQIVLGTSEGTDAAQFDIPMVLVPVGSYALGVWTAESDIDCLCVGTISSKTFFKLARQRIMKAESQEVHILRKVEASTGTMLELSVNGISMDLQYCPAGRVVERYALLLLTFETAPTNMTQVARISQHPRLRSHLQPLGAFASQAQALP